MVNLSTKYNISMDQVPLGDPLQISIHDIITSQLCPQIEIKILYFSIIILVLYTLSNMLQNKIQREKWFKGELEPITFPFPQFKSKFPFIELKPETTDIKGICLEWILPIMKMLIYACLIYIVYVSWYLRGV